MTCRFFRRHCGGRYRCTTACCNLRTRWECRLSQHHRGCSRRSGMQRGTRRRTRSHCRSRWVRWQLLSRGRCAGTQQAQSRAQMLHRAVAHRRVNSVASCPRRSCYGEMRRIDASAARHSVWGTAAAADCGVSARRRHGIVSKLSWYFCVSILKYKLFIAFVIGHILINDISNSQVSILHVSWIYLTDIKWGQMGQNLNIYLSRKV